DDDDSKKKKKGLEEKVAAEERSIAELELIRAYENGGDGSREMAEEKIPWADPDDDSRFSATISDHNYALDPTNPRFKRLKIQQKKAELAQLMKKKAKAN
ncbi:unnamed protein product, partial [Brassica rapa subsp. narinosa]